MNPFMIAMLSLCGVYFILGKPKWVPTWPKILVETSKGLLMFFFLNFVLTILYFEVVIPWLSF